MNRKARAIAKRMTEGTFSSQDRADFKAAVLVLGWEGVRGGGVLNHATGERERSYQTLASRLLWEAAGITKEAEELEAIEQAEAEDMERDAKDPGWNIRPGANEVPSVEDEVAFTYFYTTRVPTVRLSDLTAVDAYVTEEIPAFHEGKCQSGAALDCEGVGFLRVLPESMLPGSEREQMIQCLPCYEASAAAYVRKLHHTES